MPLLFDISRWNIVEDYKLLAQRTVGGFIKASEAVWPDPLFTTHWSEAREVGLLRGAYHFWRPDQTPEKQAQKFFEIVQGTGDMGELPPVLDVEMRGKSSDVLTCLKEIERLFGKRPIIYTAQGIWNTLGSTPWARDYPLWIANYRIAGTVRWSEDLVETVMQKSPFLPNAWKGADWTLWQFTQRGHGPDFGLDWSKSKQIDLNVFNGTLKDLEKFAGTTVGAGVGAGGAGEGEEKEAPPSEVEDPWDNEPLPRIGRKARVLVSALSLRNAPIVMEGNIKDRMRQGDRTVITNVRKDDNYIWCETGYRQWFAYKRRDGTQFAQEI